MRVINGNRVGTEVQDPTEALDEGHRVVHSDGGLEIIDEVDDLRVVSTFEAPSLHARIESTVSTRLPPAWVRPEIYVLGELPLYLKARRNFHPVSGEELETLAASRRPGRSPVIAVPDISACDRSEIDALASLAERGVPVVPLKDVVERVCRLHPLAPGCEQPALAPRGRLHEATVRAIDLLVAFIGCLVMLVLLPIIAAAIWLDDRGPIFYTQERVGLGGKIFRLHKIRSMRCDAERDGPRWWSDGDDRVTRVGSVLRRTKIDELPQFVNVLRGEMSLIGPRPERPFFIDVLRRNIPHYDLRHAVRPGITGWATVMIGYGNSVEAKYLAHQFDVYHLRNRSLRFDLEILARSLYVMIACPQIVPV